MDLTFYGGVNEIGGNKILLRNNNTRIFLDFGISYARMKEYYEFPLLQPSNKDDLLKTFLIPDLKGVYQYHTHEVIYNQKGPQKVNPQNETRIIDAVLLSHAHMDHYGYIGLLRQDIPIYTSRLTKRIIQLYSKMGRNEFNVIIDHLNLKNIKESKELLINDLLIKRFNVDHSILGASAYYIDGDKSIVYTGDFRLHGLKKEVTENFLNQVKKERIDYLLCEGTRLGLLDENEDQIAESNILDSEEEVRKKCMNIIDSEEDLVIYDASQADLERLRILWEVAKKTGRVLVVDSKKAYLLLNLNKKKNIVKGLPKLGDFKILLGRSKLRSSSKACKELTASCPGLYLECFKSGRKYHERIMGEEEEISDDTYIWGPQLRKKILDKSNEYLIYTSNGPLLLLQCKLKKVPIKGTYIYGKAEPFNEEMEFTFERLMNWLKLCELNLAYAHTTGHCMPDDLKRAIEIINPKQIIPVHTQHPDSFKELLPNNITLIKPELNQKIIL